MKKLRRILFIALMVGLLACLCCQPAFAAVSEEEVQAQVDAVGKEAVSGNVLIWFMCAIGFLKVSQKIDSFMASLGVNVGHTGGSMLAEALIAARGFSGFKSFSNHHFGGGHSSNSTHVNAGGGGKGGGFGAGFASGGFGGGNWPEGHEQCGKNSNNPLRNEILWPWRSCRWCCWGYRRPHLYFVRQQGRQFRQQCDRFCCHREHHPDGYHFR